MSTLRSLRLAFENTSGDEETINISHAKDGITEAQARAAGQAFIDHPIYTHPLKTLIGAEVVARSTDVLFDEG